ncbi:MAG TPA: protein-ADP-ribose hydrolase [Clostridiales bacterium]|nr:protein-ADP-ribose hydrolase [Clostridiales bacterium]
MDKCEFLINYMLKERGLKEEIPQEKLSKERLLRALFNVRPPLPVSAEFLAAQNEYLTEKKNERGVIDVNGFSYINGITLFKGDITTINAEAIVNAANSAMLGCFQPLHDCIDNAIHTAAGVQVRLDCNAIMKGGKAENGDVIVTKAYNLPSKFIFHTVGPIVYGRVTSKNKEDLRKCYANCLEKADEIGLKNIAFCCVSTGVFGYPKDEAAFIAVQTVNDYKAKQKSALNVIFTVFTEEDYAIYAKLLG